MTCWTRHNDLGLVGEAHIMMCTEALGVARNYVHVCAWFACGPYVMTYW